MQTVTSADGTALAVDTAGSGPAVILLGGAFNDRSTVAGLAGVLAPSCTVHWYDRRGRGDSGDTPPYAVEREFEDLAAVIAYAGGHAHVFGHSSGAVLALEATARGVAVDRLVAYEPPYVVSDREPSGVDMLDRMTALLAAGRRGDAVALFLTESAGVPAPVVESMQGSPDWGWMETFADSLPQDVALCGPGQALPAERLARIAVPTLVLDGGESPEWMRAAARAVAAAVPGARSETVDGEDHGVLRNPEALVPVLTGFLR